MFGYDVASFDVILIVIEMIFFFNDFHGLPLIKVLFGQIDF